MTVNVKYKHKVNSMRVMGLDVSTRTGVVILDHFGAVELAEELKLPALAGVRMMDRIQRCSHLHKQVAALLVAWTPGIICIEGYAYNKVQNQAMLAELGGAVRLALWDYAAPKGTGRVIEVSPPSLKKFVLGKGVGEKEQVMMQVYKRWGFEAASNNIADAYVLARIAHTHLPIDPGELTQPQREVLQKLAEIC